MIQKNALRGCTLLLCILIKQVNAQEAALLENQLTYDSTYVVKRIALTGLSIVICRYIYKYLTRPKLTPKQKLCKHLGEQASNITLRSTPRRKKLARRKSEMSPRKLPINKSKRRGSSTYDSDEQTVLRLRMEFEFANLKKTYRLKKQEVQPGNDQAKADCALLAAQITARAHILGKISSAAKYAEAAEQFGHPAAKGFSDQFYDKLFEELPDSRPLMRI